MLHDDGTLILGTFDLDKKSLEFRPTAAGSYDVFVGESRLQTSLGEPLDLGDDDACYRPLPFAFKFYGAERTSVFISSNGAISFGTPDSSRSLDTALFTAGEAKIAPLLDDFDPEAGGSVYLSSQPGQVAVTWKQVPEFSETNSNTFQLILFPNGTIQFHYDGVAATEGITGISNGGQDSGLTIPFSAAPVWEGLAAAPIFQWYSTMAMNPLAVAKRFYRSHEDDYDAVLAFGANQMTADIAGSAFAYSLDIRNDVKGIGKSLVDYTSEVGSAGRLQSIINLNTLSKYPADINERIGALNHSVLSLIGEEWGHRFLAFTFYRLNRGIDSTLLGRSYCHWSYFLNSEASFDEGNQWRQESDGRFTALDESRRYSRLDQYLMGLRPAGEIDPVMLITQPQPLVRGTVEALVSTFGLKNNAIRDSSKNLGAEDRYRSFWLYIGAPTSEVMSYSTSYISYSGHSSSGSDPGLISTVEDLQYWWNAATGKTYAVVKARDSLPCSHYFDSGTGMYAGDNIVLEGVRRDVTLDQIIEAEGERSPAFAAAPKSFRHAFILIVPRGQEAPQTDIARIAAIRQGWEELFHQATEGRGSVSSALQFGLSSVTESLYAGGGRTFATRGENEPAAKIGFASIEPSTRPVSGTLIMSSRANGRIVCEAAVPGMESITRARCFAEISAKVNTGVAIAAPSTSAALSLELRDTAGNVVAVEPLSIPAGGQIARFVSELFPNAKLPASFKGSITIQGSSPIAVVALRTLINEDGEFLMTTQPVADLDAPLQASPLHLPQVVAGGGYTTDVLLVNPGATVLTGRLGFYDPKGKEMDAGIPGTTGGNVAYRVEPHGTAVVTAGSLSNEAHTGYLVVRPDSSLPAPIAGAIFTLSQSGRVTAATGVAPAPPSTGVQFFVDYTSTHDTGMALVNPGTQPAHLRLTVANLQGTLKSAAPEISLAPAEQITVFVSQLIPDLPAGFRGTLIVQSDVPVAAMAMRSTNAGGRFMVATLPIVDLTKSVPPKTTFFPHLVDGAGYSSEFILLNPGTGSCMTSLRFFTSSGKALPLVSR